MKNVIKQFKDKNSKGNIPAGNGANSPKKVIGGEAFDLG
jgi:hypothetical protein